VTVTEAFQQFKSSLELPATHSQRASAAQRELRRRLSLNLPVEDSFLTGSYARYTKIHPLNDIDVMLVRNAARVGLVTSGGIPAVQALDDVVGAARNAFPNGAKIARQSRSVNIAFADLDFGFDLIPAWLRQPNGYWIPDGDTGSWMPTDPQAHERLVTQANDRTEGRLKPIIKMVKHWSRNNYDLLRSFHIELICENISRTVSLDNLQLGVGTVLVNLPDFVGVQMMDPVYGLTRVDKPLSPQDLTRMQNRVNGDAGNARRAVELEALGQHAAAVDVWRNIFLYGFPS
jgi:hypothetical protein